MKPNFTVSFLFSCLLLSNVVAKASVVNTADSLALVDLYNSTNGDGWTRHDNWLTQVPVCAWYGVEVSNGRVVSLALGVNNLRGTLPFCIGDLAGLQHLYLYGNALTGVIPSSIGSLASLYDCLLSDNQFSGAIPSSIGSLVHLQQLDLARNALSHSIPFAIGNLRDAQYISLNSNQLSGAIPHSVGALTQLRILELADNRLSGSLPPAIGKMRSLLYLYLQDNRLSGSLPPAIGNLDNLQFLYLDNNRLSGVIPDAVSHLANLQLLSLSGNSFSGAIPSSLSRLTNLAYLYLSNNNLSGTLPASFLKLANLQYLYADHNHLSQDFNMNPPLPPNVSLHADISYNNFTFDGLEFIATHYPFINYSPQALVSIHDYDNALSLHAGGTLNKNDYVWFKTEDLSRTIIHGDSSFRPSSPGHYFAWVRNTDAPQLILYTDTFDYKTTADRVITALPSLTHYGFQVYPNPAKDIAHIRVDGKATVLLFNVDGKLLLSKVINGNDVIDVSGLASGSYYLRNKTTGETLRVMVVK